MPPYFKHVFMRLTSASALLYAFISQLAIYSKSKAIVAVAALSATSIGVYLQLQVGEDAFYGYLIVMFLCTIVLTGINKVQEKKRSKKLKEGTER